VIAISVTKQARKKGKVVESTIYYGHGGENTKTGKKVAGVDARTTRTSAAPASAVVCVASPANRGAATSVGLVRGNCEFHVTCFFKLSFSAK
jgi:hypothetical protein